MIIIVLNRHTEICGKIKVWLKSLCDKLKTFFPTDVLVLKHIYSINYSFRSYNTLGHIKQSERLNLGAIPEMNNVKSPQVQYIKITL